jgi:hypothetical protein
MGAQRTNQLEDRPDNSEVLFLYRVRPTRMGRAFYDGTRNGRRHGWSSMCADYEYVMPQPPDTVMRDNECWLKWVTAQARLPAISAIFDAWKEANQS